jgi:hypothetical protein
MTTLTLHNAPALADDELTLHLAASGLIVLAQQVAQQGAVRLPYPAALQRALDRLSIAALRRGAAPPQGVPDLLDWARRPLATWPLHLPAEAISPDDTLLVGDIPSSVCDDWACLAPDVEAELSERQLMLSVLRQSSAAQDQDGYVAFRTLLIERPTLTALEFQQQRVRPVLGRLSEQLRAAYEPAPPGWAVQGEYACCPTCGNLLAPLLAGGFVCESAGCHGPVKAAAVNRRISIGEEPLWLRRGLRRFVAAPGRAELRLARQLERDGVAVELWPAFDRYDLRVVFPDGVVWAADVKDWANPFLLARKVEPIPDDPPWQLAAFVFPNERGRRPDYVRAFQRACPIRHPHLHAMLERHFRQRVIKRLRGVV